MKPNTEQDLSLKTKVLAIGAMALLGISIVVGAVGYTSYQRQAAAEQARTAQIAATLAKTQLANVESIKAVLPLFRNTKQGANTMVKIPAGGTGTVRCYWVRYNGAGLVSPEDKWGIPDNGEENNGNTNAASGNVKAAWATASALFSDGSYRDYASDPAATSNYIDVLVNVPAGTALTGSQTLNVSSLFDGATYEFFDSYQGTFKVTPPCPVSVTLSRTP